MISRLRLQPADVGMGMTSQRVRDRLIERLRGKFRYHLLLKNLGGEEGRQMVTAFLRNKYLPQGLSMAVDVDALDLV